MVSVTSVDTLRNAVALAERKVQQDRTRVDQDASRLEASQLQLSKDQDQLSRSQQETRQAEQVAAPAPLRLDRAIATPVPTDLLRQAPQLNTQGQTVGRLINTVA